jgi:hypothetical protein
LIFVILIDLVRLGGFDWVIGVFGQFPTTSHVELVYAAGRSLNQNCS